MIRQTPKNIIITDNIWIYAINLSYAKAEHILCRVVNNNSEKAFITPLHCECGSEKISAYLNDENVYTHFYCEYCGNIVDSHLYDEKSFSTLVHDGLGYL